MGRMTMKSKGGVLGHLRAHAMGKRFMSISINGMPRLHAVSAPSALIDYSTNALSVQCVCGTGVWIAGA